ncbi:MAG: hypothetical protein A4E19_15605 [Nitrospira sp. SG-bin1]|nr:MAG: hypothetical protein A4E19_15605 [Nitrospira sp. SG-bin1]
MDLTVGIGGYTIQIREPANHPRLTWPLRPFDGFLSPSTPSPDIRVNVSIVSPLPDLPSGRLLFDSAHGCWKLLGSDTGLLFESLDPKILQPRVRARISDDYRTVQAWMLPDLEASQVGWRPMQLFNPLIEVCLLSRLSRDGGLLLHAAGLVIDRRGYVFTGASGTGKSTIAGLFATQTAAVLSDERVILRRHGTAFFLYGTPWVGSGHYAENASAGITGLFCINHGQERHCLSLLRSSHATSLLLQQAFLPHWDRTGLEATLEFLASLTVQIPCHGLSFLNQPDVVDFVRDHSAALTQTSR